MTARPPWEKTRVPWAGVTQINQIFLDIGPSGMPRTIKLHPEHVNCHVIHSISLPARALHWIQVTAPVPQKAPRAGLTALRGYQGH